MYLHPHGTVPKINIVEALTTPLNKFPANVFRIWGAPLAGFTVFAAGFVVLLLCAVIFLLVLSGISGGLDTLNTFFYADNAVASDHIGALGIFLLVSFSIFWVIFSIFFVVVAAAGLYAMYTRFILDIYDNKPFSWTRLTDAASCGFAYVGSVILRKIAVFLGLCLFVFPALIVLVRLGLFRFFLVEREYGAVDALRASYICTRGNTIRLILLELILWSLAAVLFVGMNVLAHYVALDFGGLLATIVAYTFLAFTAAYLELVNAYVYRTLEPSVQSVYPTGTSSHARLNP